MNVEPAKQAHPWIVALRDELDGLETSLLSGDATAVEKASARVQAVLQRAPKTAAMANFAGLRSDMLAAAHRFGQLRQAVLRLQAQNQRALGQLMPQMKPATYGSARGQAFGSTRGAGQAYLRA